MSTEKTEEKIRVTSHGGREGSISLSGFSKENLEKMLAAMNVGAYYVRVKDGKLESTPIWEKLPSPTEDKEMLPFWRKHSGPTQVVLFDEYQHSKEKGHSPSITIQSLCGYYYTPESYKENAENLESYGFECLRSRRGGDARYSEIWRLSGLWAAKGDLAFELKYAKDDNEKELSLALEFLRRRVVFGTLDVSSQRLCQVPPGAEDF